MKDQQQTHKKDVTTSLPHREGQEGGSVLKSLSIRISTDGLSFCVYTPSASQPYRYQTFEVKSVVSMAANLKEALLGIDLLKAQYQRVNVLVSTPQFTTVPTVAFDREHIADTFNYVFHGTTQPAEEGRFTPADQQHVSYNVLRRSGIAIIFGLDRSVYQLLHDDFPRARFYAAASTLIEFFSERSMIGTGRTMYAYIHENEMTVYCFDQGRMLFVNTYPVRGLGDCQYFLLSVWKTLGFDQLDDVLEIVEDSNRLGSHQDNVGQQLVDKMRYFVRQTSLTERNDPQFAGIPYDLQTLLVCGF